MIFIIIFGLIPMAIFVLLVLRHSALIQQRMNRLKSQQKQLRRHNKVLQIEKKDLQKKQKQLHQKLQNSLSNLQNKKSKLQAFHKRQKDFHSIRFQRKAAWGSPAYVISVDAMGSVLFEGISAVRKIGFFEWTIYRKRIQNLNNVIKKSLFFDVPQDQYLSKIEEVSAVEIEIYLKDGTHRIIKYDHASRYPIELGFLERKLDIILGTQKMWLFWGQKVMRFSLYHHKNYRAIFRQKQGLTYYIYGQDYFSDEFLEGWKDISDLTEKHEALWQEETNYSIRRHPQNSIWIELESNFRFLITPDLYPTVYRDFVAIVKAYGRQLQEENPS